MKRGIAYSAGIHIVLLLIAFFGLPEWFQKEVEPQPMVITLEDIQISEKTNVQPSKQPVTKPQEKAPPPKKEPPKPPKAAPPPPPPPPPPPAPPKPVPAPKPKVEPEKVEPKKPEPPKEEPPKKPEPKTEPSIDDVLKNLEEQAQQSPKKEDKPVDEKAKPTNTTRSQTPYDPTLPLSLSEKDAITSQFVKCWRLPAGAANDYTLKVTVDVWLRENGEAYKVILEGSQKNRYFSDPVFKAAADSAIRAVKMCSPIKNLSANKYNSWKEMRLHFDPSMQLY